MNILIFILHFFSVEDLEKHDGSSNKPYFMTKSLRKIMNLKNEHELKIKTNKKNYSQI